MIKLPQTPTKATTPCQIETPATQAAGTQPLAKSASTISTENVSLTNRFLENISEQKLKPLIMGIQYLISISQHVLSGSLNRIFCQSKYAMTLELPPYCRVLLKKISVHPRATIDPNAIKLLGNLFENIKLPLEIALICKKFLTEALSKDLEQDKLPETLRSLLIEILGKLPKHYNYNSDFFKDCWDAIAANIDQPYLDESSKRSAVRSAMTTLVDIDHDGTKSYPIVSKIAKDNTCELGSEAVTLLAVIANKDKIDCLTQVCLAEIRNVLDTGVLPTEALRRVKSKIFNDPYQFQFFLFFSLTIKKIESLLVCDKDFVLMSHFDFLADFPCIEFPFIKDLMAKIEDAYSQKEIGIAQNNFLSAISKFIRQYSLTYPFIAGSSFNLFYTALNSQNRQVTELAAQELTKLISTTKEENKIHLQNAFNRLQSTNLIIKEEAINIIAYFRIHTRLSENVKEKCINALIIEGQDNLRGLFLSIFNIS